MTYTYHSSLRSHYHNSCTPLYATCLVSSKAHLHPIYPSLICDNKHYPQRPHIASRKDKQIYVQPPLDNTEQHHWISPITPRYMEFFLTARKVAISSCLPQSLFTLGILDVYSDVSVISFTMLYHTLYIHCIDSSAANLGSSCGQDLVMFSFHEVHLILVLSVISGNYDT